MNTTAEDLERTADGEPLIERGTAGSARSSVTEPEEEENGNETDDDDGDEDDEEEEDL